MRKFIFATILMSLLLVGCFPKSGSRQSHPPAHPGPAPQPVPPQNNPEPSKNNVIEGTVVKIFNLLIPSAYAAELTDCASEVEVCAKLIDDESEEIIAVTPVVEGSFRFELDKGVESHKLYRILVSKRGDATYKRIVVIAGQEKQVEISPESTVVHVIKRKILKDRLQLVKNSKDGIKVVIAEAKEAIEGFLAKLHRGLKEADEETSLRDKLKLLIEGLHSDLNFIINEIITKSFDPSENVGSELKEKIRELELDRMPSDQDLGDKESSDLVVLLKKLLLSKNAIRLNTGLLIIETRTKIANINNKLFELYVKLENIHFPEELGYDFAEEEELTLRQIEELEAESVVVMDEYFDQRYELGEKLQERIGKIYSVVSRLNYKNIEIDSVIDVSHEEVFDGYPIDKRGNEVADDLID